MEGNGDKFRFAAWDRHWSADTSKCLLYLPSRLNFTRRPMKLQVRNGL